MTNVGEKIHLPHRRKKVDEEAGATTSTSSDGAENSPLSSVPLQRPQNELQGMNGAATGAAGSGAAAGDVAQRAVDDEEEQQPEMNVIVTIVRCPSDKDPADIARPSWYLILSLLELLPNS